MQDEDQPGPSLQVVVDEGRKANGQPKKPANQPQNTASTDADRKQFMKDLQHIRSQVDRLAKDVEKLNAAHAQILDIARATGAVTSGSAKALSDKLAQLFEAQIAERDATHKALEYTQTMVRMVASSPKELERLRKIRDATDPKVRELATSSYSNAGWWVAFGVGALAVIGLAIAVLA